VRANSFTFGKTEWKTILIGIKTLLCKDVRINKRSELFLWGFLGRLQRKYKNMMV